MHACTIALCPTSLRVDTRPRASAIFVARYRRAYDDIYVVDPGARLVGRGI